jgi:hypothetical protein
MKKVLSEEHKRKIGLANKGKIPWCKGKKCPQLSHTPWNKGKKLNYSFWKGKFGKNHPTWKGGRFRHTEGYILIYSPHHPFRNKQGYVFEHRLAMEKKLGRYLKPTEQLHHINHLRDDNRIQNLILFKNASEHTRNCHSNRKLS